jgi:hypothetical protein
MSAAWVRFAKTGNPNGSGLPSWPAVQRTALQYLEFGDEIHVRHLDAERLKRLNFLAGYFRGLRRTRSTLEDQPIPWQARPTTYTAASCGLDARIVRKP